MSGITWHLDPTVWLTARYLDCQADIWWTGPGQQVGWAVFVLGQLEAVAQGTGADEADGKAQAEAELMARGRAS